MATEKRQPDPPVRQALFSAPYRFDFFKAVHLLEGFANGKRVGGGHSPADDPVRFKVDPGFSFPASDIAALRNGKTAEMRVTFMGLIGPEGVLPDWYNAHARQLREKRDDSFTDFLDIFHHRLISLFYAAWKKYRLPETYRPDDDDPVSSGLAALVGLSGDGSDPAFLRHARNRLIYFSGLISRIIPAASAIEILVRNATGVEAKVTQFVERMIPIHEADRTRLGRKNSALKRDALCGARVRDMSSFFRVDLGPMGWEQYLFFQPKSANLALIRKLVTFIAGVEYEFEIHLIIKGEEIPGLGLGGRHGPPLLGRTVLLRSPQRPHTRDVVIRAGRSGEAQA
jgi:type VI secretion system protein ImpH